MAEEARRRRLKEGEVVPPPLSARARMYLDLAAERIAAADMEPEGSPAALALAQEAIGYTAFAASRHLDAAYPTTNMTERDQWLTVLRFLSGTLMFQQPLETLTLALTELDRGIVPDGLKTTGTAQGGKPTAQTLLWRRRAVEVADEFVRQHGGHKEDADKFMDSIKGVSASTIRKWRKALTRSAPEHHPRSFRRWMPAPGQASKEAVRSYAVEAGLIRQDKPNPLGDEEILTDPETIKRARLAPLSKNLKTFCELAKKDIS
jgi:hypothetical protein